MTWCLLSTSRGERRFADKQDTMELEVAQSVEEWPLWDNGRGRSTEASRGYLNVTKCHLYYNFPFKVSPQSYELPCGVSMHAGPRSLFLCLFLHWLLSHHMYSSTLSRLLTISFQLACHLPHIDSMYEKRKTCNIFLWPNLHSVEGII